MFISFEGTEGSGKSTHARKLKEYLGDRAVLTHEPGGTELGKKIREWLLNSSSRLDGISELSLFAADRAEHVARVIQPALLAGKIVISDRFIDSTLAYQIGGGGLPEDLVRYLNMVSSKGLVPDLTFLLMVPLEAGLKRAREKGAADRFEREKLEFHKRVEAKYLEIAKENPQRVKVINTGGRGIEEVDEEIRKIFRERVT